MKHYIFRLLRLLALTLMIGEVYASTNSGNNFFTSFWDPSSSTMLQRIGWSALRGPLGIVVEHPLDLLKTLQQTEPNMSALQLASRVYKRSGIRGFYTGVVPTFTMSVIKPSYRLPLIGVLPRCFKEYGFSGVAPSVMTGASIATIETCVITPLERIKVWLMTKEAPMDLERAKAVIFENKSLVNVKPKLNFSYLYRGFGFQFGTTGAAWTTFMASNYYTERFFLKGEERKQTMMELMASGVISGMAVTCTALPADFLKTAVQKHSAMGDKNIGIFKSVASLVKNDGFSTLYAGWRLKLLGYVLRATTINVANRIIDGIMEED